MLTYFNTEIVAALLIRGATGAYVDGEWVPEYETAIPIHIITPQPVKADELSPLEDGEHVSDFLATWTATPAWPRKGDIDGDIILYDGQTYRVWQTDDRSFLGGYYKLMLRRVEIGV